MERQVKKTLIVLMLIFFVIAVATELVSASQAKTDHIKYMKADFSARPISGHAPLTVHFTDHSKSHSKVLNWSWNFGDKKTSSLQNPTHVYKHPGRYTVSLTVKCPSDIIDTKKVSNYITVK
jgi:PKD repeat protein